MNRIRRWLMDKFLPAWCRDELLADNALLRERVTELKQEVERLTAYINGIEAAMRAQRRVIIRNEVSK